MEDTPALAEADRIQLAGAGTLRAAGDILPEVAGHNLLVVGNNPPVAGHSLGISSWLLGISRRLLGITRQLLRVSWILSWVCLLLLGVARLLIVVPCRPLCGLHIGTTVTIPKNAGALLGTYYIVSGAPAAKEAHKSFLQKPRGTLPLPKRLCHKVQKGSIQARSGGLLHGRLSTISLHSSYCQS